MQVDLKGPMTWITHWNSPKCARRDLRHLGGYLDTSVIWLLHIQVLSVDVFSSWQRTNWKWPLVWPLIKRLPWTSSNLFMNPFLTTQKPGTWQDLIQTFGLSRAFHVQVHKQIIVGFDFPAIRNKPCVVSLLNCDMYIGNKVQEKWALSRNFQKDSFKTSKQTEKTVQWLSNGEELKWSVQNVIIWLPWGHKSNDLREISKNTLITLIDQRHVIRHLNYSFVSAWFLMRSSHHYHNILCGCVEI